MTDFNFMEMINNDVELQMIEAQAREDLYILLNNSANTTEKTNNAFIAQSDRARAF